MIDEDKAKNMGFLGYIMKPIIKDEIAVTIRKVLDEGQEKKLMARILIIDDDAQLLAMLRQVFEREGYEVVEAPDGKEGLRRYRENPTELIITDLIMPENEGIETIMELRRDFPDVKIIAMSGGGINNPGTYLDLAKKLGAQYTFAKPFEREELLYAVRELLK